MPSGSGPLHNGDGLTYYDLRQELVGVQVNVAAAAGTDAADGTQIWRIEPNEPLANLRDLRSGVPVARNRDMSWVRTLEGRTAERRIAVDWAVRESGGDLVLHATDEDGHGVCLPLGAVAPPANNPERARAALHECLGKLGNTHFTARQIHIGWQTPRHLGAALANGWRRSLIELLQAERARRLAPLPRRAAVEPPVPYPEQSLTYLGNVANARAAAFYARHGVRFIEAAYESHEELGEVSLMITKHCVRWSLSLCPKQAKGVTGVQGTVRAEPMTMMNGKERLTLRFDCKPCEMHVVGKMKKPVLAATPAIPVQFHALRRPRAAAAAPDAG